MSLNTRSSLNCCKPLGLDLFDNLIQCIGIVSVENSNRYHVALFLGKNRIVFISYPLDRIAKALDNTG